MLKHNQPEPKTPETSYREIDGVRYEYYNWKLISEKKAEDIIAELKADKNIKDALKYACKDGKKVIGYRVYFTK